MADNETNWPMLWRAVAVMLVVMGVVVVVSGIVLGIYYLTTQIDVIAFRQRTEAVGSAIEQTIREWKSP